jgi:two-component system, response regulator PdtaR
MVNREDSEQGAYPQIIVIVEDEVLLRLDSAEFLRDGGYEVREAANASQAMDLLRSELSVDLLFTDINLGKGLSGIELALWALGNLPRLKILVTTGEILKTVLPRALGTILIKPYTDSQLMERVEHALAT